jgi:hypothetical protein
MAKLNRRQLFKGLAATSAVAAITGGDLASKQARAAGNPDARFLIVIPAFGGAQLINSVLPIRASEAGAAAPTLDCFPDEQVVDLAGSPIRAADAVMDHLVGQTVGTMFQVPLSPFIDKHKQQMMVTTLTGTSVNHAVAQHRALTGGGAWGGRTLQECVAMAYGDDYPLPNVNMSRMGYLQQGDDTSIPSRVRAEPIAQPLVKPLSFSASKGLRPGSQDIPAQSLIDMARALRNDKLDPESSFYQAFRLSERIKLWTTQRSVDAPAIEAQGLIDKLFFVPESPELPLSEFDLQASEDAVRLATVFPDIFGADPDPLERQAALAYLLIKNHASVSVTLSPTFAPITGGPFGLKTVPLAFDGSHNDHRAAQALMWFRVLDVADRLIDLLAETVFDSDSGESFMDRTMVHFATDFGRDKRRPGDGSDIWGTAHNINNGHVTISPLVNGNTVLGGVDPTTGMTYGFDLQTGAEAPSRNTSEAESFAGLLQALGVDTSEAGLVDVPAMRA